VFDSSRDSKAVPRPWQRPNERWLRPTRPARGWPADGLAVDFVAFPDRGQLMRSPGGFGTTSAGRTSAQSRPSTNAGRLFNPTGADHRKRIISARSGKATGVYESWPPSLVSGYRAAGEGVEVSRSAMSNGDAHGLELFAPARARIRPAGPRVAPAEVPRGGPLQ